VLKKGKIVDSGRHEELVSKEGFYKEMWNKQQGDRSDPTAQDDLRETKSWVDVDTLLDLLERQGSSNEVLALARRIRPTKSRLYDSKFFVHCI